MNCCVLLDFLFNYPIESDFISILSTQNQATMTELSQQKLTLSSTKLMRGPLLLMYNSLISKDIVFHLFSAVSALFLIDLCSIFFFDI